MLWSFILWLKPLCKTKLAIHYSCLQKYTRPQNIPYNTSQLILSLFFTQASWQRWEHTARLVSASGPRPLHIVYLILKNAGHPSVAADHSSCECMSKNWVPGSKAGYLNLEPLQITDNLGKGKKKDAQIIGSQSKSVFKAGIRDHEKLSLRTISPLFSHLAAVNRCSCPEIVPCVRYDLGSFYL